MIRDGIDSEMEWTPKVASEVQHCAPIVRNLYDKPDTSFEHARNSSNKIKRSGTGFLGALANTMVVLLLAFLIK